MAAERDTNLTSDADASEKPVREQLKKASISKASGDDSDMASQETAGDNEHVEENGEDNELRDRVQKKRSFEEVEEETHEERHTDRSRGHGRKRSRDSTAEEDELNNGQRKSGERARDDGEEHKASNGEPTAPATERPRTPEASAAKRGEAAVEEMTSPKTKRSRLHHSTEENGTAASEKPTPTGDVPEKKSTVKQAEQPPKAPSTGTASFGNTSAASPSTSLASPKAEGDKPRTSDKAFAASGFSAFSGSSGSGFGSIGKTSGGFGSGGGFGTGSPGKKEDEKEKKEKEKDNISSSTAFGGALGQKSAFAGAATGLGGGGFASSGFGGPGQGGGGFGGLGGGSGGAFGGLGGGGLTSFASGKPSAGLAGPSKPAKPFGAAADEDEEGGDEEGDDEAGFKSPLSQESDKQDERFYEQELETGEEEERTEYSTRAKLYNFVTSEDGKKEWKERGMGTVRLNLRNSGSGDEDAKPSARLLMRAEGSHRVILNTPIKKEIKFGDPSGGPPQGQYVYFMGAVDGKKSLELLQLKMRQQFAQELHEKVLELQSSM